MSKKDAFKLTGHETANELESLLVRAISESANNAIWEKFERALQKLDSKGLAVFEKYLDGFSLEQLSKEEQLSQEEVLAWIKQLKRELNQHLRAECNVRQ